MKSFFAAALLLAAAGCAAAQPAKFFPTVTAAAEGSNLVAFANALKDNGLDTAVNNATLVATIFAPSDEAFKALADSKDPLVQGILADKTKLAAVLKYHVVPGAALNAARITKMITDSKDGSVAYSTLQGERLNATADGSSVLVNGVPVTAVDTQGGKVLIHTISEVLVPPTMVPKKAAAAGGASEAGAEAAAKSAAAPTSGAASLVAGAALALPLLAAALL